MRRSSPSARCTGAAVSSAAAGMAQTRSPTCAAATTRKGANAGANTWYFAEGEGKFFNTFFSVANPQRRGGQRHGLLPGRHWEEVTQTVDVPANGPTHLLAHGLASSRPPPGRTGFATTVTSDACDVVAERADVLGAWRTVRHSRRSCGEGVTTPSAVAVRRGRAGRRRRLRHLRAALQPAPTPIDVTVKFFGAAASRSWPKTTRISGAGARNVAGHDLPDLANQAFAIRVDATQPFVAERAVYWRGLRGHATAGATARRASGALPRASRAAS